MKPRVGGEIVYFLVVAMSLLLRISQGVGVDDALGVDMSVLFTLAVQLLIFGLLPVLGWWMVMRTGANSTFRTLPRVFCLSKCHSRDFGRTLLMTVPILLLVGVAASAWQNFIYLTGFETGSSVLAEVALSAVLPGIFEEFVHRGMLSTTFRDSGGKFIFVSALLFALMHQNILQFAHTFVLGLILACIVYCTGSVFPAMFVHFFNNFISVVSGYDGVVPAFGVIGTVRGWLYGSVAGVVVLIILAAACCSERCASTPCGRADCRALPSSAPRRERSLSPATSCSSAPSPSASPLRCSVWSGGICKLWSG